MQSELLIDLIKKEVRDLNPYCVEPINVRIKLNAMENPYPLSQILKAKIQSEVNKIQINRYPDPEALILKKTICAYPSHPLASGEKKKIKGNYSWANINPENILIGNGSDELIQIIFTALAKPGESILIPIPTFAMYKIIATPLNIKVIEIPLQTDNWQIEPDNFIKAIKKNRPKIVVLANPNNPTGNCFDETAIRRILDEAPGIVIIDEAYYDFSGATMLHLMDRYSNLIILRTLSKIGMAGLRVGFMIADERLITQISKVRLPYNINTLSQAIARVILENRDEIDSQIEYIIKDREYLFTKLQEIRGIVPYESKTNFILFRSEINSELMYNGLIDKGILIRAFGNNGPLKSHLRVTVGTKEENTMFLNGLTELCG